MEVIKNWSKLAQVGTKIIALEYYQADLPEILLSFKEQATELKLPVYYWNIGYRYIQSKVINLDAGAYFLCFCNSYN